MISCIAIDDEPIALDILSAYAAKIDFIDLQKTFTNPDDALRYIRKHPVDLVFLDIMMPDVNGVKLYKSIPSEPMVIFTTAHHQFAVKGFEVDAIDYLLKPYEFDRFLKACNKAVDFYTYQIKRDNQTTRHLIVRAEYSLVKILLDSIIYIEGLNDYVKIYSIGQKPILSKISMKMILDRLPSSTFSRIHRSYIVSLDKIEAVRNKKVFIAKQELPIGITYEEDFMQLFSRQ